MKEMTLTHHQLTALLDLAGYGLHHSSLLFPADSGELWDVVRTLDAALRSASVHAPVVLHLDADAQVAE